MPVCPSGMRGVRYRTGADRITGCEGHDGKRADVFHGASRRISETHYDVGFCCGEFANEARQLVVLQICAAAEEFEVATQRVAALNQTLEEKCPEGACVGYRPAAVQ